MKALAALATITIVAAIGFAPTTAAERTARLTDPAATGSGRNVTVALRQQRAPDPESVRSIHGLGLSEVERDHIRATVRAQIQALASRNADQAFSYLAPVTKDFFSDSDNFLQTLNRQMIPMMYAKRFLMAELEREALDAVQTVVLTGPKNHEWLARFKVERQPDGSWRVKSCHMELAQGQRI